MSDELEKVEVVLEGKVRDNETTGPTAYLISSGSYSDYSVACVVLDKDEADKLCELMNEDKTEHSYYEYFVEDRPLAVPPQTPTRVLEMFFEYGTATRTGNIDSIWNATYTWDYTKHREREKFENVFPFEDETVPRVKVKPYGDGFTVRGSDIERVRKVYSERRAEFIAEKEGLTQ